MLKDVFVNYNLIFRFLVNMFGRKETGEYTFYHDENERIVSYASKNKIRRADEEIDQFFQKTVKEGQ